MLSKEVAKSVGIYGTQVAEYALRLGITRGPNGWPADLPEKIKALRAQGDPRAGATVDGVRREGDYLLLTRVQVDGRTRTIARVKLTREFRQALRACLT